MAEFDWDNFLLLKFRAFVNPNWVCCDIGSCKGYFTRLFKELVGENGMVYSFDINNNNIIELQKLAGKNCIIEHKAVSDNNKTEDIYDSNSEYQTNIIGHDVSYTKNKNIGKIKSVTLDSYFKDKNLNCLKIDAEGSELKIIKGGIKTIKKCNYTVIECHFDEDWGEIYNIFLKNNLEFKDLLTDQPITLQKRPYQIYLHK